MNVQPPNEAELIDVLERVVEAGVLVDPWLRVTAEGIDLVEAGQRLVPIRGDPANDDFEPH